MTQINDVDRDNFLERIKDGLFTFIQIEIIFTIYYVFYVF